MSSKNKRAGSRKKPQQSSASLSPSVDSPNRFAALAAENQSIVDNNNDLSVVERLNVIEATMSSLQASISTSLNEQFKVMMGMLQSMSIGQQNPNQTNHNSQSIVANDLFAHSGDGKASDVRDSAPSFPDPRSTPDPNGT